MGLLEAVIKAATRAVNANSKKLEDLQRAQFDSGKDANGNQREPYKASTKRYKRAKGQPTNRVTLKDTGESYKAVKVSADNQGITVDVPTKQFNYMVKKYGDSTIGVEPETLKKFIEQYVLPDIKNEFTRTNIS